MDPNNNTGYQQQPPPPPPPTQPQQPQQQPQQQQQQQPYHATAAAVAAPGPGYAAASSVAVAAGQQQQQQHVGYHQQQQQQQHGGYHPPPPHPASASMAARQAVADSKIPPGDEYEEIREQDRYLPIANISRIMKNRLPENAKIAKDSKETVQECVSEFISFITSEASDKCMQEKRKTINGDDLLWAMSTLGFDKYVEPLKVYLAKYREAARGDKPDRASLSQGGVGVGVG
eukprot:CAMPEP_0181099114 /NCGR_PEP_ID=MMETSP1071-20121207/12488_1 /TAXON_ID=35127 /ORGANISM="Thalassiosira sp., Strain NH16" /LENGTH=230 /DNA_ID=CAMNT_0023181757 /DNA_START=181 /DNA_END=870 /DNA_ORIENTATION=+